MQIKDYLILLSVCLVSVVLSVGITKKFVIHDPEIQEPIITKEQLVEIQEKMLIVDSLRLAGNKTITVIKKTIIDGRKEIPIIYDEDSLVKSINNILKQ